MTTQHYTLVGSRKTPPDAMAFLRGLADVLHGVGLRGRSGDADGADQCVYGHAGSVACDVYLAGDRLPTTSLKVNATYHLWPNIPVEYRDAAMALAREIHPAPDRLTDFALRLHARNCFQVLGADLSTPSKVLICWAPTVGNNPFKVIGGTRTAVEVALRYNVPVLNVAYPDHRDRVAKMVPER